MQGQTIVVRERQHSLKGAWSFNRWDLDTVLRAVRETLRGLVWTAIVLR